MAMWYRCRTARRKASTPGRGLRPLAISARTTACFWRASVSIISSVQSCPPHVANARNAARVLIPAMSFFDNSNACADLRKKTIYHREREYPVSVMIMELQWGYYMHYQKLSSKRLISDNLHKGLVKFRIARTNEVFYMFHNQKVNNQCLNQSGLQLQL